MLRIFRVILTLLQLIILLALFCMLLNSFIPPKTVRWLNFLSLAFPVLIIVYIILTVYWILKWKKRAIFFLIALLFFFNPIRRWVNYSEKHQPGSFKMVTFNVHAGLHLPELRTFLESQNPDVILLQEKGVSLIDEIKLKDYKNVYYNDILAIYSKYRIKNKGIIVNEVNTGTSIYADIDVNGKTIRFINIYLEPFFLKKWMLKPTSNRDDNKQKLKYLENRFVESFQLHQDQVDEIRKFIDESPYPVIIGGDMNAVPNSYEYYTLSKGLTDSFMSVGRGLGTTFHDYKFPIRIDYLFTDSSIKPETYEIDRNIDISDHYPVIATFNMK